MQPRTPREEIHELIKARDIKALAAIIENFKRTPPSKRAQEIIFWIINSKIGFELFMQDQEWRDTLTNRELNEVNASGRSILQVIALQEEGRALIDEDKLFRRKITAKGFNAGGNKSAAYQFVSHEQGLEILLKHPELAQSLGFEFLNATPDLDSQPQAFHLSKSVQGVRLLVRLFSINKISETTLNYTVSSRTIFSNMMKYPEGLAALAIPGFRKCVHKDTLNMPGHFSGIGALELICGSEVGAMYLANTTSLVKKIQSAAFNDCHHGRSPASQLAKTPGGYQVFLNHKRLVRLLEDKTLNAVSSHRDDKGGSLVLWLLVLPGAREVLQQYPALLQRLNLNTLLSEVEAGDYTGESIATLLQRKENADLLNLLPEDLREVIRTHVVVPDAIQKEEMMAARNRFFSRLYPEKVEASNTRRFKL